MKLFFKRRDGGPQSHVDGFWLIEWKSVFSVCLLRFNSGTRENFHSHAFGSLNWLLTGAVRENLFGDESWTHLLPRLKPYYRPRTCMHKVDGIAPASWVLSVRGPWAKTWQEFDVTRNCIVTLAHGRKEVSA